MDKSKSAWQALVLPHRLVRFALRDLKAKRKELDGFLALGNETSRSAEYDKWISALEAYCTAHGITAAQAPTDGKM